MMQGDSYGLPIEILKGNAVATPEDVSNVEFMLGHVRKTYADSEIVFSADTGEWVVHLTQNDTFMLRTVRTRAQLRVKWKSGGVEGFDFGYINVIESLSKEVL